MKFSKFVALIMTSSALTIGAGSASAMQSETAAPAAEAEAAPVAQEAPAAANPVVGGAEMLPTKNIVENASASQVHTTLVAAIKAAGLVEALSGPGPFTVFAPDNDAFKRLSPGVLDTLMKPESKPNLERVLKYHVIAGKITSEDLIAQIDAGGGKAVLTTLEGSPLTATKEGGAVVLTDVNGNIAYIAQADVNQSNGVIHVVNGVLAPKLG